MGGRGERKGGREGKRERERKGETKSVGGGFVREQRGGEREQTTARTLEAKMAPEKNGGGDGGGGGVREGRGGGDGGVGDGGGEEEEKGERQDTNFDFHATPLFTKFILWCRAGEGKGGELEGEG